MNKFYVEVHTSTQKTWFDFECDFSRFWAQFALEDFCCPVPKLNRLFMVGSCFTGHAIQLFWHMSTCYQIILRIFFHKISQTILVIQEFQIILVCSHISHDPEWPFENVPSLFFFHQIMLAFFILFVGSTVD